MTGPARPHFEIREDWLARQQEDILLPDLPIVDAHHHLWETPAKRYRRSELLQDLGSGHRVVATVFVEGRENYRTEGPTSIAAVGETEFVVSQTPAEGGSDAASRLCAALVGFADLTLGDAVVPVLEAHIEKGQGRFRGIRSTSVWHPDPDLNASAIRAPQGLLGSASFRRGFSHLEATKLSFDAWLLHTQFAELQALADDYPGTRMVLNHLGGPLGIGPYRARRTEVFSVWRSGLSELARRPNLFIKLGGVGMPLFGFDFARAEKPPTSQVLAQAIKPYVETCIELFGVKRCMFESNFPVDKGSFSYLVAWNAFKRVSIGASDSELESLFWGSADDFYALSLAGSAAVLPSTM